MDLLVYNRDMTLVNSERPASRLRAERIKRGWTQLRLSQLSNIAASDLSSYENNRRVPGRGQKERLAQCFGMSVIDLFGDDDSRTTDAVSA